MNILRPKRLKKGDLIGIVSPASPVADPAKITSGVRYLESLGYQTMVGRHVTQTVGYLAGTDKQRAEDIHTMFSNKQVRAIICVRGGYGTPRLLSILDYRLMARNPKILVGFSDITALELAIWKMTRMITFHGPMLAGDMAGGIDPFTEEMFWRVVTSPKKLGKVLLPDISSIGVLQGGSASGRLLGGNLALVASLLGTRYQPDFRKSVLMLEDIGEEPYRIDRMLVQLKNSGVLEKAGAILGGRFTDCVPEDKSKPSLSVEDLLLEAARGLGKPFLVNLPFGHARVKMTLPIGLRIRVNAGAKSIEYMEPAVY
jgi:muramoyltetrapeptide carboxypeptidase